MFLNFSAVYHVLAAKSLFRSPSEKLMEEIVAYIQEQRDIKMEEKLKEKLNNLGANYDSAATDA
ncbi:MAG: hypothetical protein LBK61_11495 [Spirochaetaceae bacterium]|nr:hypothetical protein [Spirochaetaceae bacterium]